jgi:cell division septation protein DedD
MTTHDDQRLTSSYDESDTAVAETPPVEEHTAPNVSDDPSAAADETSLPSRAPSPVVGDEQTPSPSPAASPDPATASGGAATSAEAPAAAEHASVEPESSPEELLFADDDLAELRGRWGAVQAAFVDDPKDCVQKADVLVSDLVEQLTTGFSHVRSRLEEQWARGEEASTEDLRVALMHYREFFERLLAV